MQSTRRNCNVKPGAPPHYAHPAALSKVHRQRKWRGTKQRKDRGRHRSRRPKSEHAGKCRKAHGHPMRKQQPQSHHGYSQRTPTKYVTKNARHGIRTIDQAAQLSATDYACSRKITKAHIYVTTIVQETYRQRRVQLNRPKITSGNP